MRTALQAGFTAKREQGGDGRTRPGDVFLPQWDSNGPEAVDVTVRHTFKTSGPLRQPERHLEWMERQESDKHEKYDEQCNVKEWTLVPFVILEHSDPRPSAL